VFLNSRTGQKQMELKGYKTETEDDAKARLEAAGWQVVDYEFDDATKVFKPKGMDMKDDTESEQDD